MKKYLILLLSCVMMSSFLSAKELSKEEKKRIKSQLKEYLKDPDAYQKMVNNYKQTIDTQNVDIAQRKETIRQLSTHIADLQSKITRIESELKACQDKPAPACPPCPIPGVAPSAGTIYKVQIGLFKNLDMTNYLKDTKYIEAEKAGQDNRYVISYFTDKGEAERFVADLRKLGLKGAFVATYENGEKVSEYKKSPGKAARKKSH